MKMLLASVATNLGKPEWYHLHTTLGLRVQAYHSHIEDASDGHLVGICGDKVSWVGVASLAHGGDSMLLVCCKDGGLHSMAGYNAAAILVQVTTARLMTASGAIHDDHMLQLSGRWCAVHPFLPHMGNFNIT